MLYSINTDSRKALERMIPQQGFEPCPITLTGEIGIPNLRHKKRAIKKKQALETGAIIEK